MADLIKRAALLIGLALLVAGCAATPKNGPGSQSAAANYYQAWTTAQLQSRRTQLLREVAAPDLKIDPVTGASSSSSSSWQDDKMASRDLNEIQAELLRRDPSGKLLRSPGM